MAEDPRTVVEDSAHGGVQSFKGGIDAENVPQKGALVPTPSMRTDIGKGESFLAAMGSIVARAHCLWLRLFLSLLCTLALLTWLLTPFLALRRHLGVRWIPFGHDHRHPCSLRLPPLRLRRPWLGSWYGGACRRHCRHMVLLHLAGQPVRVQWRALRSLP